MNPSQLTNSGNINDENNNVEIGNGQVHRPNQPFEPNQETNPQPSQLNPTRLTINFDRITPEDAEKIRKQSKSIYQLDISKIPREQRLSMASRLRKEHAHHSNDFLVSLFAALESNEDNDNDFLPSGDETANPNRQNSQNQDYTNMDSVVESSEESHLLNFRDFTRFAHSSNDEDSDGAPSRRYDL